MKRNTSCWKDGNNNCNLIITLCLALLMNGLLLQAWTLTNNETTGHHSQHSPQSWPWTDNFWKAGDLPHKPGNIVHLLSHKKWNKLQK